MDYIVISGVRPYDGRYEFDAPNFDPTVREWGWIKRLAGYLPLTLDEGIVGGDAELIVVLAIIALRRHGRIQAADVAHVYERFQDAPFGSIVRLELGADEGVDEDPTQAPTPQSLNANGASDGAPGRTSSATSGASLPATGRHGLVTSE